MIKKRTIIVLIIIPFILGLIVARTHHIDISRNIEFTTNTIPLTDRIIMSINGDVYEITANNTQRITRKQQLSEPTILDNNITAVSKTKNYASLLLFDASGRLKKTLFNGNSSSIDSMKWISDPAVDPKGNKIAYVSDQNRQQTNIPDNALFLLNVTNGTSSLVAKPDPYSGGITHPVWNPQQSTILLYDFYQYDPQSLTPFSSIKEYHFDTQVTTTLTTEKQNAYQESYSPDGKKLLFLERNIQNNNAILSLATISDNGINHVNQLLTGDIAYPMFSYTPNVIYYLQADGNQGYNLIQATVTNMKLVNPTVIISGAQLLGNSSYTVSKNNQ